MTRLQAALGSLIVWLALGVVGGFLTGLAWLIVWLAKRLEWGVVGALAILVIAIAAIALQVAVYRRLRRSPR